MLFITLYSINKEILIKKINTELEKLISDEIKIITKQEATDITSSLSPAWKSFRKVYFEWYESEWCGCWWTHLSNTSDIWRIEITKIRTKKMKD